MRLRIALFVAAAATLGAQSASFDVASLKPAQSSGDLYRANLGTARHGEVTLTNTTLSDCLRYAYGITNDAQIVGPDWIRDKGVRFNILAKAPPTTPFPELQLMLQNLLTERFQLKLHHEMRELTVLVLVAGKNGIRFQEAKEGSSTTGNSFIPGRIISNSISMHMFATLLTRFQREPVLDMTGLKGMYELKLEYAPEALLKPGDDAEPVPGASIYSALQSQLGLKLESRKGPQDVLVIDHAEKTPIGN